MIASKKISNYWKCQFIGWTVFSVVAYIFNNLIYPNEFLTFIPFAISIFLFGITASHLLKLVIRKSQLLSKRFSIQVVSISAIAVLVSVTGTALWMFIMIRLGFWIIEGDTAAERQSDFAQEYFFNLFPVLLTISGWMLIYFLYHYVKGVRREEQLKLSYQLQLLEFEARALRAQMNPHFIFNSLNSIKSLIQQHEEEKVVLYLTTFSKLIRTLFSNANKKEVSLHDELETCRLYLQLEAMRFAETFTYDIRIDETIDLKSVQVPALIIQPFIENAIWHGIVPKGSGHVDLLVQNRFDAIEIVVDDNGIGREAAQRNRSQSSLTHQSEGIHLTQSRLQLDHRIKQRKAGLQIIDKKIDGTTAQGTRVILSFENQLS